jgi:hypothetical protein
LPYRSALPCASAKLSLLNIGYQALFIYLFTE